MKANRILLVLFLTPLISTLVIGGLNLNKPVKLRFLIWQAPSLSLGSLIALGCTTGAILSFTSTATIIYGERSFTRIVRESLRNKKNKGLEEAAAIHATSDNKQNQANLYNQPMPVRDISDPSPTLSVGYRVIKQGLSKDVGQLDKEESSQFYSQERNYVPPRVNGDNIDYQDDWGGNIEENW